MDFVGGIFVDMSGYSMRKTEENMRNLENKKTNTSHYNNNCNDDYTFISPRAISNNCYCEFYEKSVSINNECIRCPAARMY